MRSFTCGRCGSLLFFENSRCLTCGATLAFSPARGALETFTDGFPSGVATCANAALAACNWLVEDGLELCRSCRLTRTRPGDGDRVALHEFADAERAKRWVIAQLIDLGLPVGDAVPAFDMLSSSRQAVSTGHADGLITIDLAEADDVQREQRRSELGEPYRTMVGHLRHELGHYFQDVVLRSDGDWEQCRELFGDERSSYEQAQKRHYHDGPPSDWSERFISAYATMHPWEDWAETFAHYLHIKDMLQTAAEFGVAVGGARALLDPSAFKARPEAAPASEPIGELLDEWLALTYALNALSRSMGLHDMYPFTMSSPVVAKLSFVDERVRATVAQRQAPASA